MRVPSLSGTEAGFDSESEPGCRLDTPERFGLIPTRDDRPETPDPSAVDEGSILCPLVGRRLGRDAAAALTYNNPLSCTGAAEVLRRGEVRA